MFIVGLDLGKRKSQLCIQDQDGKILAEVRVKTEKEALAPALHKYPGARVLMEASTSAQWVACHLESLGHVVVIGDPRFGPMYAQANKKIKTDKRDARALADALRMGAFRETHRKSQRARQIHGQLLVRKALVELRTGLINQVRALCEREGLRIRQCDGAAFLNELNEHRIEQWLYDVIKPAIDEIDKLDERITACDNAAEAVAQADPVVRNLRTINGVGALTALAFFAVIDDPTRFSSAREVVAYLGLAPSQRNSGDSKRRPGAITKAGDPLVRGYLYEAAMCHIRKLTPETPLKVWGLALAAKQDRKKKAVVGVARRLARILWAMWRDNKPFDGKLTAPDTASNVTPPSSDQAARVTPAAA